MVNFTNFRSFLAVLSAGLISIAFLVSCNSEQLDMGKTGRNLEIHASRPQVVSKAFYTQDGITRIITPSASNRKLAVVNTTIVNRSSTVIPISVDPDAATLGDRRGKKSNAIDPFARSKEISGAIKADPDVLEITPVLWGEIELARGFQVSGSLVFDVPKGLILGTIFWDEVEYIPVDFIDYWKDNN